MIFFINPVPQSTQPSKGNSLSLENTLGWFLTVIICFVSHLFWEVVEESK